MRRSEQVFFFTLVDFLLQVSFFGLLLYVLAVAQQRDPAEPDKTKENAEKVAAWTGFSTITELTEFLSNLAPPSDFRGWADFISAQKTTPEGAKRAKEFVDANGGEEKIGEKLKKYDEAYGLPPCETVLQGTRRVPAPAARMRITDASIQTSNVAPFFVEVLAKAGTNEAGVSTLSLAEFRAIFSKLRKSRTDCVYFVDVEVATKFLEPMDALQSGFRISSRR